MPLWPSKCREFQRSQRRRSAAAIEELIHPGIIADVISIYLQLHPVTPQRRFIRQAVEALRRGAVIVYPTDSCYALGCHIGATRLRLERIVRS